MNSNPQSRKAKIQLLKNLQEGKISLHEIKMETPILWNCANGIYTRFLAKDGLQLTEKEFTDYVSKRPKQKNIIFCLQKGYEPFEI